MATAAGSCDKELVRDGGQEESVDDAAKRRRLGPEAAAKPAEQDGDEEAAATLTSTDAAYFEAYDELAVHALMLGDMSRVDAYAAALRLARDSLKGKVVLDVGAGSGILSLLAAKHAAPAMVYAVEAVPGMARMARALVSRNGFDDTVRVFEGRIEDVELPGKVDAIVSEWMGFYLLHESMLESVLVARDRWLKPGGALLPSSARIWAALVEAEELRREIEGCAGLHGLDLSPIAEAELQRRCGQPQVELVEPARLLTSPALVADLGCLRDMRPNATAELHAEVALLAARSGRAAGVAFWFDVGFEEPARAEQDRRAQALQLSTSPGAPPTHWKQTVVYLGAFVPVEAGDVLPVQLALQRSAENPRQYNITVETA